LKTSLLVSAFARRVRAVLGIALAALAFGASPAAWAADHLDSPSVKMTGKAMADITDVYAWMSADGMKVNLAMAVSPAEDGTHSFGPAFQYVFHVVTYPGATNMDAFFNPGSETKIICTFASPTSAQCWVATGPTPKDYVTGDPSSPAGITSRDQLIKVFAGKRSDPFFFNLGGFLRAQSTVETACGTSTCPGALPHDAGGCPLIDAATAGALRGLLTTAPPTTIGPCAGGQIDCFANFNVMAIVVQVDKTLLNANGNHLLSVWGSTHASP
jgi:hypothetical protein